MTEGTAAPEHITHKPRSLLTEVGIVVLGVLLALAAQQAADAWRWSHDVAETRQALADELSRNIQVVRITEREDPCNLAHLDAVDTWAQARSGPNPNPRFRPPSLADFQSSAWDVAKTSQIAGHIPLKERLEYARLYSNLDNMEYLVLNQRETWREFTRFSGKASLTVEEAARIREAVSLARHQTRIWHTNNPGMVELAKGLGGREPPASPPLKVPDNCGPSADRPATGSAPDLSRRP